MDGTPGSVWDCVKPLAGSLREKWDENVTSFEVIQSFTDVSPSAVSHGQRRGARPPRRGSGPPPGAGSTSQARARAARCLRP